MTDYYGSIDQIKVRCLIATTDETKNSELTIALGEASRYIDDKIRPYQSTCAMELTEPFRFNSLPLCSSMVTDQISYIAADFGAAVFLRRHMPDKYSDIWWSDGEMKIAEFIKSQFFKEKVII